MAATRNSRTIQRVSIGSLRLPVLPVKWNPKKQIQKAAKFLAEFGQAPLIYAGADGEILFGEEFWLALQELGATEVDVVFLNDKSPIELKAIRLALHRIPEDARWIDHNVRVVLDEIETAGIELDLTGFDPPEIDSYLNLDLPNANVEETGVDIPEVEKKAVTTSGSIWRLGEDHQLGCGSATDLEFVRRVCGDRPVNMSFIDPPYNLPVRGFISGKGRNRHREFVQGSGELSDDQYFSLLRDAFAVLQSLSTASALVFSCIDWRHVMEMLVAGRACGMSLYQIVAWIKSNGGMGGIYRNQHELICIFRTGQETPLDNVELGKRGRNRTNVWHYGGMSSFGRGRDELLSLHPTVKPVAMIADALRDCTKRGDLVADTFAGSGSTLMAAEETGRLFRGVELDPLYVNVAVRRWQNLTDREAVSVATSEPFNSVRQRLLSAPLESDHGS